MAVYTFSIVSQFSTTTLLKFSKMRNDYTPAETNVDLSLDIIAKVRAMAACRTNDAESVQEVISAVVLSLFDNDLTDEQRQAVHSMIADMAG